MISVAENYLESRQRFREAAQRLHWIGHVHALDGETPQGEPLTIDVAISPNAQAKRVVVVSSGLHGVECSFGAAVQLAAMQTWSENGGPPADTRVVFLHALNPYGFAWSRRQDAENIDPNRNFLSPGEAYRGSPEGYPDFDPLINPKSEPRFDFFTLRAAWARMRYGLPALKQTLVVGQHDFPQGLFFGGHGPCATQRALHECLPKWIGVADSVLHLDYHTGLGKWASYKLLLDAPTTPEQRVRLDGIFGHDNIEEDHPNGVAYLPRGSLGPWCMAQGIAPDYIYLVAEFGTYGHIAMLAAMRAENGAHYFGQPNAPSTLAAKARLREVFCPEDAGWRKRVIETGNELIQRAVASGKC